jgi:hypothetical protein
VALRTSSSRSPRVALNEIKELLCGHAEQRRERFILGDLDARNRRPIHAAKGLEIAAVIENCDLF